MGYHVRKIEKGTYGTLSKVVEELEEAIDAYEQGQDLMLLIELSDIIGAVEGVAKKYGMGLDQLHTFAKLRSKVAVEEMQGEGKQTTQLKRLAVEKGIELSDIVAGEPGVDGSTQSLKTLAKECGIYPNEIKKKRLRNFVLIMPSYQCNKECPYCIAKAERLPTKTFDLNAFRREVEDLREEGYTFEYFVLSGNGEPSFYSFYELQSIVQIVEEVGIFNEKRIQTSGAIFYEDEKFRLFKDWVFEVTRVSVNRQIDMQTCKYTGDYTVLHNYANVKKRINIVMCNYTLSNLIYTIQASAEVPNVKYLALKILDRVESVEGTEAEEINKWIEVNGVTYSEIPEIRKVVSERLGEGEVVGNTHKWQVEGVELSMSINAEYLQGDVYSLYWYGDNYLGGREKCIK